SPLRLAAAGRGVGRVPAIQLPSGPYLHGRRGEPVLRLHAGDPGGRGEPAGGRETVVPDRADAAVRRVVRRGVHAGTARAGGRAAHRAAPRASVSGRATLRRSSGGRYAGVL